MKKIANSETGPVRPRSLYTLRGFTSESGFRIFRFSRQRSDRSTAECTVRADLELVRKSGISFQELPLLCCDVLERLGEGEPPAEVEFGPEDVDRIVAIRLAARAAEKKRPQAPKAAPRPGNWPGFGMTPK